ncbi:helix-turn-helix domain-containing protein [Haloferax namakaokahaiae]|uniref:Helix-turn-helix domain-containing protein n=1 Tax=Haloferax namakaokahaiae TaxID=1748331 RepID=A0ABD5ZDG2_9EURY
MTLFSSVHLESPILQTSVEQAGEVTITLKKQTKTADGELDMTLWVSGDAETVDDFEAGMDADETVSRWVPIGGSDTQRLYQTRTTRQAAESQDYHGWTDGRASLLAARHEMDGWTVEMYLQDRSVLQRLASKCESNDVKFELLQVSEIDRIEETNRFGLSEVQTKTLLTALERGYYSVPREENLEELSKPLDVSHQAVSERLRRGVCSLIENTIAAQWDGHDATPTITHTSPSKATTNKHALKPPLS